MTTDRHKVRRRVPSARLAARYLGDRYGDNTERATWVIVDERGDVLSGMPTRTPEEAWRRAREACK